MKLKISLLSICYCLSLFGECCLWHSIPRNQLYIGPEIYQVHREKFHREKEEGGAQDRLLYGSQEGLLYGFRMGYDRIKRYHYYLGADFLYATGELKGYDLLNNTIKSTMTDINLEGRAGYTIEMKCWWQPSLTPFVGGGYFWESNDFQHPSPKKIHFQNKFNYVTGGFLSRLRFLQDWTIGVNFKLRYLISGKIKVTNDPNEEDHNQTYQEKLQYRVELPITNYRTFHCYECALSVVPFYEYRPYGRRENFPQNFFKTTYNIYGATFKFMYLF